MILLVSNVLFLKNRQSKFRYDNRVPHIQKVLNPIKRPPKKALNRLIWILGFLTYDAEIVA